MIAQNFFRKIYKDCSCGHITITTLPDRKTRWFKCTETEKISKMAENLGKKTNVFFGVGLRNKVLPKGQRGSEKDILGVTALYADIDIKGNAHAQTSLPSSVDEATDFLHSLKIKPSIIVNSGNGIHGYWLLNKPFIIKSESDRRRISSIFRTLENM